MEKVTDQRRRIEIFQIDAFTSNPFHGNPAAVTFANGLNENQMQVIAKEMNLAETAFLSDLPARFGAKPHAGQASSNNADYNLRWFTPTSEVDLCGHATIASLHFLKEKNLLNNSVSFETRSGIINCKYENGFYFMQIPIFSMKEFKGDIKEILNALEISENEIDENTPPILLENGNLYLHIKNLALLKNIKPDFKGLKNLTETKNDFSGLIVFTLETVEKENSAHSRYFAPFHGIDEDIVTGSANGPLLLVLRKLNLLKGNSGNDLTATFEQGDGLNRPGRVKVKYSKSKNELYISGNAVTVLKGVLTF